MLKENIEKKGLIPYKSKVIVYVKNKDKTTCRTGVYVDIKDNELVILNKNIELTINLDLIVSIVIK